MHASGKFHKPLETVDHQPCPRVIIRIRMSILLLLIIFIDQCTGQGQLKQSSLMLTVLFLIIISLPSIDSMYFIDRSQVDQICSQNCSNETCEQFFTIQSLPFCSNAFLNISSHRMNFTNEEHCRQYLQQLIQLDDEARIASNLFANYIQAIDPGEEENPYAKSDSDCQKAYRRWTCSVKIPYFYRSYRILPCQTICDEVERVCPTFRPSEREPLFAGQPLFFCNGGLLVNSDYAQRPHCFDTCHLSDGSSLIRHSVSSSSRSRDILSILPSNCFDIEPLIGIDSNESTNLLLANHSSFSRNVAISLMFLSSSSAAWSRVFFSIFIFIFLLFLSNEI